MFNWTMAQYGQLSGRIASFGLPEARSANWTKEPLVGALLISASIRRRDGYRARTVAFIVFGVVLAPLVGASVGASATAVLEARAPGSVHASHPSVPDEAAARDIGNFGGCVARTGIGHDHLCQQPGSGRRNQRGQRGYEGALRVARINDGA